MPPDHIWLGSRRSSLSEHMQALEAANFSKVAKQIRSLSMYITSHVGKVGPRNWGPQVEGSSLGVVPLLEELPDLECLVLLKALPITMSSVTFPTSSRCPLYAIAS